MKSIRNIFHKQIFSNFYLHLTICLLILSISCWSLFYYDTYPVAQSESGIFFYPSFAINENLTNWSEFYMGSRNSIQQTYQTFFFRFFIKPDSEINPFYVQFSYYLIMFYFGFFGFYKSLGLFNSGNRILNLYLSSTYIFNPVSAFFLLRFQYPYITFYYLFPIIYYLTHKAFSSYEDRESLKNMFLLFLLLAGFSVIYASMPTLFLLFLFWFIYLFTTFVHIFFTNKKSIKSFLSKRIIPFFIIWFILNMYWAVPYTIEQINPNKFISTKPVLNKNENIQTFTFFSQRDSNFINVFSLITNNFLKHIHENPAIQKIILSFSLIPFLTITINILYILKGKKLDWKYINNLFVISVLAISFLILIRGDNYPFGLILKEIMIHVPFFQVLRNPQEKVSLIFTFLYLLIFSLSFIHLYNDFKKYKLIAISFLIFYILVVSFRMFDTKLLLGTQKPFNNPKTGFKLEVPKSYKEISLNINRNKSSNNLDRTLFLPTAKEGNTYKWDKGYIGVDFIQTYISNDSYSFVSPDIYEDRVMLIENIPFAKDKESLMNLLGVSNIIFRNDFDFKSRNILDPTYTKKIVLAETDNNYNELIPLENLSIIYSKEKNLQINYGHVKDKETGYRFPMDWSKTMYLRIYLFDSSTIPPKTTYRLVIDFSNPENIKKIVDFNSNSLTNRVSFSNLQYSKNDCTGCFSTNYIYTDGTRRINSFEFLINFKKSSQYLYINNLYLSKYKFTSQKNRNFELIKNYNSDRVDHYVLNKKMPLFISPTEIIEVPNVLSILNSDVNPDKYSYVIKKEKAFILPFTINNSLVESIVEYKKISSNEYILNIKPKVNVSSNYNTLITFNYSADPLWKFVAAEDEVKFADNTYLFEDKQFISNTYANSWYLENIPSTGLKLRLLYVPYIYFKFLYPISSTLYILIFLTLIYLYSKDYYNARHFK